MLRLIIRVLRGVGIKLKAATRGSRIAPSTKLDLHARATFRAEKGSRVYGHGNILIEAEATFAIGGGTSIMQGAEIVVASGASLLIERDVYVGSYSNIRCNGRITIGDAVRIAQFVSLIDANYDFRSRSRPISAAVPESLVIERGAWIGSNVVVLPGVTVGEGAVVGAGSVVTKSVPPFAIAVGNPARVVAYRE